jgi:hypothetical protein
MRHAFALVLLLACACAAAQGNPAISDEHLIAPWIAARGVALTLPAGEAAQAEAERLDEALSGLAAALQETAISIVGKPEFSYDAAQRSSDLARQVGEVERLLGELFRGQEIAGRPDAQAAQAAIASLRATLAARASFERDVLSALGSGSRTAIQALAARWWKASERVDELRQVLAARQEGPSGR